MKIEFKDHKKVITHPTGHINEYDKDYLIKIKGYLIKNRDRLEKQISEIEADISKL